MRILGLHFGPFIVAHGGGSKCDRTLLRILAEAGHEVLVLLSGYGGDADFIAGSPTTKLTLNGMQIEIVNGGLSGRRYTDFIPEVTASFEPDSIFVSGTDIGHQILRCSQRLGRPVAYFPRSTWDLCAGPAAPLRLPTSPALIKSCDRVFVHSEYMKSYVRRWCGVDSAILRTPLLEGIPDREWPRPSATGQPFTCGFINPSKLKGIDIILGLAASLPKVRFVVVPGWATTSTDLLTLERHPNVELAPQFDNPAAFYPQLDLMLVPSLWDEAFGCVAIEAMAFGRPVLAADVGGLGEAMGGLPFRFSSPSIPAFQRCLDERGIPVPVVPPREIGPWVDAILKLSTDVALYVDLSAASQVAARAYDAACGPGPILDAFIDWQASWSLDQ